MRRRLHIVLLISNLSLQSLQLLQTIVESFLCLWLLLQGLWYWDRSCLQALSWRRLIADRRMFQELRLLVGSLGLGQRVRFDLFVRGSHRLLLLQLLLANHQSLVFYWLLLWLVFFIVGFLFAIFLVDLLGTLLNLRTLGNR